MTAIAAKPVTAPDYSGWPCGRCNSALAADGSCPACVTALLKHVLPAYRDNPSVQRLCTMLAGDPTLAPFLPGWIAENYPKIHSTGPLCRCGKPATWMCSICRHCLEREESRAEATGNG